MPSGRGHVSHVAAWGSHSAGILNPSSEGDGIASKLLFPNRVMNFPEVQGLMVRVHQKSSCDPDFTGNGDGPTGSRETQQGGARRTRVHHGRPRALAQHGRWSCPHATPAINFIK